MCCFHHEAPGVCFSLKVVDKLEESRGRATKMMYGLDRRRIRVYKYLKGNIKGGERLFTAMERSLTGNKELASRSRGKLSRTENKV